MLKKVPVLLLACLFPLFFIPISREASQRSIIELWDLAHFFYFFFVVYLLDRYWKPESGVISSKIIGIVLVLLSLSIGVELIQPLFSGREFSWNDFLKSISGGCVALSIRVAATTRAWRIPLTIVVVVLVVSAFLPLVRMLFDEQCAREDFPILAPFEAELELSRWEGSAKVILDNSLSIQGKSSGKIQFGTELYSGISLRFFPGDWRGRGGLAFNIYNPDQKAELYYRVHDAQHQGENQSAGNRFNGKTTLKAGWNEIIIPMVHIQNGPKGRLMDLARVNDFTLFVGKLKEKRVLYIDHVRLIEDE